MSPSVSITTRITKSGKRYVVRFRMGGRAFPLIHAGSFRLMKEARTRRDLVAGELAAGRDPRLLLRRLERTTAPQTLATVADRWVLSRVDLKQSTLGTYRDAVTWLKRTSLGDRDPAEITSADLQEVVSSSKLSPRSLQTYMSAVKQILDFAGIDPNPARGRRVRLPRVEQEPMNPPPLVHVEAIIQHARPGVRLPLRILAETGIRVGELLEWTWGDVDIADSRILVRQGKTKAARRWVQIDPPLMNDLLATVPPDDRARDRRLFELGESTLRGAIRNACVSAGIPHYSPHDFRHRHISVLLKRGNSRAEVAQLVGHSNTNELATYEHVVLEDA